MSGKVIVGGISFRQGQQRFGQFKHVVVRLNVRVWLVRRRKLEVIQPDTRAERYAQQHADRALRKTQMLWTNQQNRSAENEKQWPAEADNAPRRFIFDDAVGNQAAEIGRASCRER